MAFDILSMFRAEQPPQNRLAQPMGQQQGPMNMLSNVGQKVNNFRTGDFGQGLGDMFAGWAMGSTPQESLGMGAKLAMAGKADRRSQKQTTAQQNQTVEWLKGRGMDENQARIVAGNSSALSEFIKNQVNPPSPETTDDITEYNFAKQQGFGGSFQDFMTEQRRAGATTVNNNIPGAPTIGTVPQGWAAQQDQSTGEWTMAPIAGGPAAMEQQTAEQKQGMAADNALNASDVVTTAAARARQAAANQNFGSGGTTTIANIPLIGPMTDSGEVVRQVDSLKSQASIGNLQAMRDASPTGGALGSVTEKELKMLEDKTGALDPNSPNFLRDLDDYERTLLRTIHGREAGDRLFMQTRQRNSAEPDLSKMTWDELQELAR